MHAFCLSFEFNGLIYFNAYNMNINDNINQSKFYKKILALLFILHTFQ